ncbi:MurR/RpiR family transcriptional regulator [Candidatus Stoquefichus massiliensis]|uniref:MurR/RpiR family transcriptional regulator n=1 Tax=Candidatus Stoquefichus massiliensis TaxID=1470350 RepID=UPI0004817185|nr:MurR/RpiR family transcriptional regulator [Candidatus Stoquefichus massiliensis]
MFNLMIILLSTINSEPKDSNNYKIAKFIIENIHDLEEFSLTDFAQHCYVSNSSISRFCRDIGLRDFSALKTQIARYAIEHAHAKGKFDFKEFDAPTLPQSYILSVIDNLKRLYQSSFEKDLNDLVKDIHQYKNVAAFGYMQSENVALNLQYDLQTNGKILFTCIKFIDQVEYINHADEDTLIIIFSESGTYFDRVFQRTKPFKQLKNKPKIYMITSNFSVTLPYIDGYIRYQSRRDFASHPYPLMIITDLICVQYAKILQDNCQ